MFVEILSLLLDFNNVHQHVKDSKIPATKKSIGLFKIYIFIYFWLCWVFVAEWAFR